MAAVRAQVNRLLVVAAVLVALPAVAVAERVRPGAGRRVARRAVLLCARACAVRFEVRGTATDRDAVLVANHASPLDIPALLVACPGARFVIAITSGVPVVPVAIDGTGRLLRPKRAFAVHSGTVTIDFLAPIDTADRALADRKALRDEVEAAVRGALVA